VPEITPCLWFDGRAMEAAEFYTGVFPDSAIEDVAYYADGGMGEPGSVMIVTFSLDGRRFTALNGGPRFTFDEAVSFQIPCDGQAEVDHYWDALTDGGREGPCGWLTDRFGLSWQVVPTVVTDILGGRDPARAARAMRAVLAMTRPDVAAILAAADGRP
jgi:predicted 3-demethylubiquinone-9 3-methyltransferase (glyoxalase superfamily)